MNSWWRASCQLTRDSRTDSLKPVVLTGGLEGNFFASFALGYLSTTAAGLAAYPFDTVRRRMMMTSGEATKYKSTMDAFAQIIKHEGGAAMFRGACEWREASRCKRQLMICRGSATVANIIR